MTEPYEEHLNGIPWDQAPIPRRWHRCKAQTVRHMGLMSVMDRCACGAYRDESGRWRLKNARRRRKL